MSVFIKDNKRQIEISDQDWDALLRMLHYTIASATLKRADNVVRTTQDLIDKLYLR